MGTGLILFIGFLVLALPSIFIFKRKESITKESFLISNRNIGLFLGSISITVAWVRAPALFVASQKAFEQGIPGLFRFTLPNALALLLF